MIDSEVAAVGGVMYSANPVSFISRFFEMSAGLKDERSNAEIKALLAELEKAGYKIDENEVVFGNEVGMFWPNLVRPGGLKCLSEWP